MRDLLDSWQDDDTCNYCGLRIRHGRPHHCNPEPYQQPKPGWYVRLSGRLDGGPFLILEAAVSYAEAVGGIVVEIK